MENFFSRYKNPLVLMAVLFIQVVALATQVKRPEGGRASNSGGTRLIRVWSINAFTPFERAFISTGRFFRNNFHNYIDLYDARKENRELQEQIAQLKMEQIRLRQDAEQARRLQSLLGFKDRYIGQIMPAQVIGTSGSDLSRVIYIDKGWPDGVKVDMAVVTPDGVVGKIKDVFRLSSQVLMVTDRESGAGVILQNSRLQGILRGTPQGELRMSDIMADEKVEVGEQVVTSGGDRIYPKGVPVGTVSNVAADRDNDTFLSIRIKPAADLGRLEEVLVVTKVAEEVPQLAGGSTPMRAADILAQRLPSVATSSPSPTPNPSKGPAGQPKPVLPAPDQKKQANAAGQSKQAAADAADAGSAAKRPGADANQAGTAGESKKSAVADGNRAASAGSVTTLGAGKSTAATAPSSGGGIVQKPKPAPAKKPTPKATPDISASRDRSEPTKPGKTEAEQPPPAKSSDAEKPPR